MKSGKIKTVKSSLDSSKSFCQWSNGERGERMSAGTSTFMVIKRVEVFLLRKLICYNVESINGY